MSEKSKKIKKKVKDIYSLYAGLYAHIVRALGNYIPNIYRLYHAYLHELYKVSTEGLQELKSLSSKNCKDFKSTMKERRGVSKTLYNLIVQLFHAVYRLASANPTHQTFRIYLSTIQHTSQEIAKKEESIKSYIKH
jgi:hypothetical protein